MTTSKEKISFKILLQIDKNATQAAREIYEIYGDDAVLVKVAQY